MLKVAVTVALVSLVTCSLCPNNQICGENETCCQDSTGEFSCCPVHHSFRMVPSKSTSGSNNTCPDGSFCPAGFSCLLMSSSYGCCPVALGLTCSDGKSCCPRDHECSADSTECLKVNSNVPCDDTVACDDGTTCCKTKDGGWACCPLPQAVCCEDFIHCCPHGTTCNVAAETCDDSTGSMSWLEKIPVKPISIQDVVPAKPEVNSNVACDDTVACDDGNTCCKTKDGGWACCPLPQAVCCEDFIHCCPHGTTCDLAAGSCDDSTGSMSWLEKIPVKPISIQEVSVTKLQVNSNVPCDDTVACDDGTTCCKTKDGGWGCCPLPQAVCCEDFIHCCPHGTTCNVAAESCDDSTVSVSWLEKIPVKPISIQEVSVTKLQVNSNVACDDTVACDDGNTCCKTKDGGWACCPLPQAVCCEDFIHCCPHGTTCDLAAGSCDKSTGSMSWLEKVSAYPRGGQGSYKNASIDSSHACPESYTCCKGSSGKCNCCPMPEAVCCAGGEHCCPLHYTCDASQQSCIREDVVIPWFSKVTAQKASASSSDLSGVRCDAQTSCSSDSTCCRLSAGEWGCCPLPGAVCCSDQQHCCPTGYACDFNGGSCVKMDKGASANQMKVSRSHPLKDIKCGDGSSCSDDQTCCPTSASTWACCPSQEAVCCDDMKHCCPHGYRCGKEATCVKVAGFDLSRSWFASKKRKTRFL